MRKKGQMQIGVTMMILLVFVVLLIITLAIYFRFTSQQFEETREELLDQRYSSLLTSFLGMPEFKCTRLNVESECLDASKLKNFKNLVVEFGDDEVKAHQRPATQTLRSARDERGVRLRDGFQAVADDSPVSGFGKPFCASVFGAHPRLCEQGTQRWPKGVRLPCFFGRGRRVVRGGVPGLEKDGGWLGEGDRFCAVVARSGLSLLCPVEGHAFVDGFSGLCGFWDDAVHGFL